MLLSQNQMMKWKKIENRKKQKNLWDLWQINFEFNSHFNYHKYQTLYCADKLKLPFKCDEDFHSTCMDLEFN